jgi:hypothetical protein
MPGVEDRCSSLRELSFCFVGSVISFAPWRPLIKSPGQKNAYVAGELAGVCEPANEADRVSH